METVRLLLEHGANVQSSLGVLGSALQAAAGGLPSDILQSAVKTRLITAEPFYNQGAPRKYREADDSSQQMVQSIYSMRILEDKQRQYAQIRHQVEQAMTNPGPQQSVSYPQAYLQQQAQYPGILGPGMTGAASSHFLLLHDYGHDPVIDQFLKTTGYPHGLVPHHSSSAPEDEGLPGITELLYEVKKPYRMGPDNIGVMKLLLEYGADPDAEGGHFGTALLAACSVNRAGVVRWLVEEAGADINKRVSISEDKCVNALSIAAEKWGLSKVTKYLMSRGVTLPSGVPLDPPEMERVDVPVFSEALPPPMRVASTEPSTRTSHSEWEDRLARRWPPYSRKASTLERLVDRRERPRMNLPSEVGRPHM